MKKKKEHNIFCTADKIEKNFNLTYIDQYMLNYTKFIKKVKSYVFIFFSKNIDG